MLARCIASNALASVSWAIPFSQYEVEMMFNQVKSILSWYGSMNLLSRDDVEDNIMRVESREIAEELLGAL